MTENQKHAAVLSAEAALCPPGETQDALLAGAKALEGQGRWHLRRHGGQGYLIPVDRLQDWDHWLLWREAGEPSAIVPEWAVAVPEKVVITGWELP